MRKWLVFIVALRIFMFSTTYYVDNTATGASDSNNGTSQTFTSGTNGPWLTIAKCISTLSVGDTCNVLHGTYNHARYDIATASTTYLANSGVKTYAFYADANNVVINGFELTESGISGGNIDGLAPVEISFNANTTGVQILNNTIHDVQTPCVRFSEGASLTRTTTFLTIKGNTIYNCGVTPIVYPNVGNETTPYTFTITANSNDAVLYQVNGGATQGPFQIPAGSYSGATLGLGSVTFGSGANQVAIYCGAEGNCAIQPTNVVGPTTTFTLLSTPNSAYATMGWVSSTSNCTSVPCSGVLDGNVNGIQGESTSANQNHDILIDGNTISHIDEYIGPSNGDNRWVIRNNTFGPIEAYTWHHVDAMAFFGPTGITGRSQILAEHNFGTGNLNADNRGTLGLFQNYTDFQIIARFNYDYNSKGGADYGRCDGCPGTGYGTPGVYFYNNTIGVNAAPLKQFGNGMVDFGAAPSNQAANNLWYNACCSAGGGAGAVDPYQYTESLVVNNDLYYGVTGAPCSQSSGGGTGCTSNNPVHALVDPLVNASTGNYNLTSSSAARNAGVALTTTANSGSGSSSITLTNPYWFQDGWAGTNPDCIAVGTITNVTCFSSGGITYASGVASITPAITWSNRASVWLYSKSDGVQVLTDTTGADIGAFPYTPAGGNPTTGVTIRKRRPFLNEVLFLLNSHYKDLFTN